MQDGVLGAGPNLEYLSAKIKMIIKCSCINLQLHFFDMGINIFTRLTTVIVKIM